MVFAFPNASSIVKRKEGIATPPTPPPPLDPPLNRLPQQAFCASHVPHIVTMLTRIVNIVMYARL